MEKKYNSLKEALPSLLEEKARLDASYKLDASSEELDELEEELTSEICEENRILEFIQGKIKVLQTASALEKSQNEDGAYSEMWELYKELQISCDKLKVLLLTKARIMKNKMIIQGLNLKNFRQKKVSHLIEATSDISKIVGLNFKGTFNSHSYLFDAAFNDVLDTNNLAWIYEFSIKNNYSLSVGNKKALINNALSNNIPAYMCLIAINIEDIPDEDMIRLFAAVLASNDKKYIAYLYFKLFETSLSTSVLNFILSQNIIVDDETRNNYNENLADELEQALLNGDCETLNKLGISCEDGSFVYTKCQLES